MSMVQMNVRIDSDVKDDVDEILKRKGKNPSSVVRELWDFIRDSGDTPDLQTKTEKADKEAEKQRKLKAIEDGATLWSRTLKEAGLPDDGKDPFEGMSYKEIRDLMYDEQYDEYLREQEEQK
ncbi:MAG: damage-inducible protein J [Bifidobacterium sp.]|nr:damage-inducible protein J [Bifidobacterium sp.]